MSTSARLRPTLFTRCSQISHSKAARPLSIRTHGVNNHKLSPHSYSLPPALESTTAALSYHWDTLPPTPAQIAHASKFFQTQRPQFLWSAPRFCTMAFGESPEVCFLGRSNVGKSSLLNALLCQRIAHTSSKPGRTKQMNAFAMGPVTEDGANRMVILDMPGYGKGSRTEWGTEVMKYLSQRKQLKRAFLLVNSEHGVKESDKQLLAWFKEYAIPYQVILSKVDKVIYSGHNRQPGREVLRRRLEELRRLMESVKEIVQPDVEDDGGSVGEIIACSAEKWIEGKRMGLDAVRFAMLQAAGLELQQRAKLGPAVDIVPHEEVFGRSLGE